MRLIFSTVVLLSLFALSADAQGLALTVPEASSAAAVEQRVGITQFRVSYHRPAIAGRKIWGDVVPYGEVWRAGANENTTLTSSTPFKLGGKALAAGTYGIHMIPGEKTWVVILSTQSGAWGSYGYEMKEDALRVSVTPQTTGEAVERLLYTFDDPTDTSATLALRWDKVKVAIKLEVDTPTIVMAHMRAELRGGLQFNPQAWEEAARYFLAHNGNLEEAARMADRSMSGRETYRNVMTRSQIAEKMGDVKLAASLRSKADTLAGEPDFNSRGYELLSQHKIDEAIAVFTKNTQTFPNSWNAFDSLAEAYVIKGDKAAALQNYKKALTLVKDSGNKARIEATINRIQGQAH